MRPGSRSSKPFRILALASAVGVCLMPVWAAAEPKSNASSTESSQPPGLVAPADSELPAISGTPQEGLVLTGSVGTWEGNGIKYSLQWQRCDLTGATCADLAGATGDELSLSSGDVGSTIRLEVTASNHNGTATATSDPTSVVAPAPAPEPEPAPEEPSVTSLELVVSVSNTRTGAVPLQGQSVGGSVYVFTMEDAEPTAPVAFFLDEEPDDTPYHVEKSAPHDLEGGSVELANPWDTTRIADGSHRIVAVDGAGLRAEASFVVDNVAESTPVTESPSADGTVRYRQDWEYPDSDGVDSSDWGFQCDNIDDWYATRGSFTKVSSPVAQGAYAARFDLPADTEKPTACEMLHGRRLDHGVHDYYALAVRFGSDWREPAKAHWGMAIFQPNYQGIKGPAVGLFAHDSYVNVVMESGYCGTNANGVFECQYRTGNGTATGNIGTFYAIPKDRFGTEAWHELVVHVHWTADSSGIVEVFHRRKGETAWVKTAEIKGYPTLQWKDGYDPTSDKGTTDKFGAYRGKADYPLTLHHDSWCRATTFTAAESCL